MKLGIMQPYFFPYIGYFQLINSVDQFVIYDSVNYIKGGWINRNKILLNNKEHVFTLPVKNLSSFRQISEIEIDTKNYGIWLRKFLSVIHHAYSKAPYYIDVCALLEKVLAQKYELIVEVNSCALNEILNYIKIDTEIIPTSKHYKNSTLHGQERIIDICLKEKANTYINMIGGVNLYQSQEFLNKGIELRFLKPNIKSYSQYSSDFLPSLSIIDVLMFNPVSKITELYLNAEIV